MAPAWRRCSANSGWATAASAIGRIVGYRRVSVQRRRYIIRYNQQRASRSMLIWLLAPSRFVWRTCRASPNAHQQRRAQHQASRFALFIMAWNRRKPPLLAHITHFHRRASWALHHGLNSIRAYVLPHRASSRCAALYRACASGSFMSARPATGSATGCCVNNIAWDRGKTASQTFACGVSIRSVATINQRAQVRARCGA